MSKARSRPKLISTFSGPGGQEWRIYHARRSEHPKLFKMDDGRSCHGITYYKTHRIYIDSSRKPAQIFETTLHELLHVALEDVGMLYVVEEPIVDELAVRVAFMLEQLGK